MIYPLFPQANISILVMWSLENQNMVLAVGKSILNRTAKTDYGGDGHEAAGTSQVNNEAAGATLAKLLKGLSQGRVSGDGEPGFLLSAP